MLLRDWRAAKHDLSFLKLAASSGALKYTPANVAVAGMPERKWSLNALVRLETCNKNRDCPEGRSWKTWPSFRREMPHVVARGEGKFRSHVNVASRENCRGDCRSERCPFLVDFVIGRN
jgi:hypothetical protein